MSYVDVKYARLVGGRLELFKEKSQHSITFDAPIAVTLRSRSPKQGVIFSRKEMTLFTSVIIVEWVGLLVIS